MLIAGMPFSWKAPGIRAPRGLRSSALIRAFAALLLASGVPVGGASATRPEADPSAANVQAPEFVRTSRYVAMRDGTRIALDIFRPARDGKDTGERLPVILKWQRYQRAQRVDGKLIHALSPGPTTNALASFVAHGYTVVVADVRGSGASFGTVEGAVSAAEARDSYDLIAWLADQPWSNGRVGMFGNSYAGQLQILAASEQPPALKALFCGHLALDIHLTFFPGGARLISANRHYSDLLDVLDGLKGDSSVAPVDGDDDRRLLNAALAEHRRIRSTAGILNTMLEAEGGFRDALPFYLERSERGSQNLWTRRDGYRASGIPLYAVGGLRDLFAAQMAFLFADWTGPRKLLMGPWSHAPYDKSDPREQASSDLQAREALRWFDYWLKGIDNGIMREPPVRFAVTQSAQEWSWRESASWPPAEGQALTFYLREGPSGTIASQNDGLLLVQAPPEGGGVDRYRVDATTTTGRATRLDNASGRMILDFPEMSENDRRSLTYTTPPLERSIIAAGHPTVSIFLGSSEPDAMLVAWLEEVDELGRSTLIAEGSLKASHRTLAAPPYAYLGLPWTSSLSSDVHATPPLDKTVAQLSFPLMPTTNVFDRGHRIRLTIAAADAGNLELVAPNAVLKVYRNRLQPSLLTLPVLPAGD